MATRPRSGTFGLGAHLETKATPQVSIFKKNIFFNLLGSNPLLRACPVSVQPALLGMEPCTSRMALCHGDPSATQL